MNSLQVDETVLHHLLRHLTTGPALDKVVTSGEGVTGGEMGPKAEKQVSGNLAGMAGKTSDSGTEPMDVDAVSKGTGKG